jgi:hypothetical protein
MGYHQICPAVAGFPKGIVPGVNDFRIVTALFLELWEEWSDHFIGDVNERKSNTGWL